MSWEDLSFRGKRKIKSPKQYDSCTPIPPPHTSSRGKKVRKDVRAPHHQFEESTRPAIQFVGSGAE